MGALLDIYIKAETLETLSKTVQAKGEKGLSVTVSVNDETNEYGQNTYAFVSQSKEQREAKAKKFTVGNGKVFWTDGGINLAVKKDKPQTTPVLEDDSDLPF